MDIEPPISKRTTGQLLDIVETAQEWRPEVLELAKKELVARGVPVKTQEARWKIRTKCNERVKRAKERASYTNVEKLLIVLTGPILIFLLKDFFMFYAGAGYKKKNRQGWFYLLLGFCLWAMILYWYLKFEND